MSEVRTLFAMGVREYVRTPVLLALLLFLPTYFVLFFTRVIPDQPVPVDVPVQGTMRLGMTAVVAAVMAPMATAFVGGAAGLFLMQSARTVDGRLSVVGADRSSILVARAGVLALAAGVATVVSAGVMSLAYVPERPGWFLLATVLIGLLYGGVGALVGLVLNRLAGVYVLLFGPLLDLFLAQSPLTEETHWIAPYLPGHYPMRLAFDAAFTARVLPATLWPGLGYLLVVAVVVGAAFHRTIRVG
ncbi:MAG: hypothetical protein ABEJ94_02300 [Halorientalis sp.]